MKKEIRRVSGGICQVTTTDERFYVKEGKDAVTGLPIMEFRPSVTWITGFYPKGKGFEAYLKRNGDDADEIVRLAGERGSKVHQAIAVLNGSGTVKMESKFTNTTTGAEEELTADEYAAVMSYAEWWKDEGAEQFEILGFEFVTWPDAEALEKKYGIMAECFRFAGTIDLKVRRKLDGAVGIIDIKTSKDVYPSHEMQVNAYAVAEGALWQAILQVGYTRNKTKKYKFTEVVNKFSLFVATMQIWQNETMGQAPLQRDFPLSLSLGLPSPVQIAEPVEGVPESFPEQQGDPMPEALRDAVPELETPQRPKAKKVAKS
jgi:hypothetical protein